MTPVDRGRFETAEHMKAALKEQALGLRSKHIETDWYCWNELLLEIMRTLQITDYVTRL